MSSSSKTSGELQTPSTGQIPGSFPTDPASAGFQAQRNLAREVHERRDEYTKTQKIRIKIGSWNVAALPGAVKDLGEWFAHGKGVSKFLGGIGTSSDEVRKKDEHEIENVVDQEERQTPKAPTVPINDPGDLPKDEEIGVYALGLQEIVDVNSAAEALRPFNDPHPSRLWKEAVEEALPDGYVLVAEHQLVGLLLLVYASPQIAVTLSSVSTTHVGTGLMGYMGNKGAVGARIVFGERTKVVFINSHLAAGSDKASLDRRNWDFGQILQRVRFAPIDHGNGVVEELGDEIGNEDFAFWFGDLNYRLGSIPGGDVRRLLMLHTRNEYDSEKASVPKIEEELKINKNTPDTDQDSAYGSTHGAATSEPDTASSDGHDEPLDPSEDPTSVQTTIASLFVHDQLHEQMRLKKAFHDGWREGPVRFLPTYKYDVGSVGMFDSSEKRRAPSWCDRILFRTRKDYVAYLKRKKEDHEKHKRDQEMKARGLESGTDEIIFDYDPDTDAGDKEHAEYDEGNDGTATEMPSDGGEEDRLHVDFYTSHQRVLSSDHKPLDAVFTMEYDAIDPERKAMIHQEVAREIDRAENEGRPAITVILDSQHSDKHQEEGCYFGDLRFREEKSVMLTLGNTSPVSAKFSFLAKEGLEATPSWLRLVFHHDALDDKARQKPAFEFTLEPGDSMNVEVTAQVISLDDLQSFNEGSSKPEDILILRVRNGRDHFIPVQAHWLRSCFGISLDKLVRLPKEGVRAQPPSSPLDKEDVRSSAPRELFRLTEALEENLSAAVASRNAYSHPEITAIGWPFFAPHHHQHHLHHYHQDLSNPSSSSVPSFEIHHAQALLSLRSALDTGSPLDFPATSPASSLPATTKTTLLASTLTLFLTYLPHRLIPSHIWTSLSNSLAEHERAKRAFSQPPLSGEALRAHVLDVLSSASPVHSVSFAFVVFMLGRFVGLLAPLVPASEREGQDGEEKAGGSGGAGGNGNGSAGKMSSPLSPKSPETLLRKARGLSLTSASSTSASTSNANANGGAEAVAKAVEKRRREIERAFVEGFVLLVFEEEDEQKKKGEAAKGAKEKRREAERKRIVLEVFLREGEGEG